MIFFWIKKRLWSLNLIITFFAFPEVFANSEVFYIPEVFDFSEVFDFPEIFDFPEVSAQFHTQLSERSPTPGSVGLATTLTAIWTLTGCCCSAAPAPAAAAWPHCSSSRSPPRCPQPLPACASPSPSPPRAFFSTSSFCFGTTPETGWF